VTTPAARTGFWIRANHGTFKGAVRQALTHSQWLVGGLDELVRPDLAKVQRLVFVCLGNINRSCFAEAAAKRLGAHAVSVGLSTTTGAPAFQRAVATARDFGVDLSAHRATDLTDYRWAPGDLLLAMEMRHVVRLRRSLPGAPPVALLGGWASPMRLHIHDPHVLSPEYFKTCFSVIDAATRNLVIDWRGQKAEPQSEIAEC